MGTQSTISRMRYARLPLRFAPAVLLCLLTGTVAGQTVSALATPLLLPTSVVFDAQGNLYVAETNHHVIRKVDATGVLSTIAGDGTQGFSGDGGPATAAQLDSPTGIAVDAAGNVYVADTHNHRVRRIAASTGILTTVVGNGTAAYAGDGGAAVEASLNLPSALAVDAGGNLWIADVNNHRVRKVTAGTGVISTVAGSGLQGFAGDGGLATAAALDSPSGLAVDVGGNLYLADTRNHRVRVVSAATGIISTLAGTGTGGFFGDGAAGASAALALPSGISVDAAGNVTIADTNNQRVRRVSAARTIETIAGDGTQAFAGDGGTAVTASLDSPQSVVFSQAGLVTVADTGNQRVRQIAANGTIATVAGLGALAPDALSLSGPATVVYGTGSLTVTVASNSTATGSVSLFDGGGPTAVASVPIVSRVATFSTAGLNVGMHHLYASYGGDLTHAAAQSAAMTLTVTAAPVVATVSSASILYGQSLPALSGTLSGVLPQDAGKVMLALTTPAAALSRVGSYPIAATLTGAAAGNYALAPVSGAVLTITKAPSAATLSAASLSVVAGQPLGLAVHVASTTSGTPTGSAAILDGGMNVATLALSGAGDAMYSSSALAVGTHTLTVAYPGDGNFLGSTSIAQTIAITPAISADFTIAVTGTSTQTVTAGNAAVFPFAVQMQGAALSSPITLGTSALPAGVTANFSPNYLPPGGAVTSFSLTVQTPKASVTAWLARGTAVGLCVLFLPWMGFAVGGRRVLASLLCFGVVVSTTGCGARVFAVAAGSSLGTSYPITVTATATGPAGAPLVHTATVTVNVQ